MMDTQKNSTKPTSVMDSVKVSLANARFQFTVLIHHLNQAHRQYVDSDD